MPLNCLSLTLAEFKSNILLATTNTNYTLENPAAGHSCHFYKPIGFSLAFHIEKEKEKERVIFNVERERERERERSWRLFPSTQLKTRSG